MMRLLLLLLVFAPIGCDGREHEASSQTPPLAEHDGDEEYEQQGLAEPVAGEQPRAENEPATVITSPAEDNAGELFGDDGMPTESALDALLGERGCRHVLGKLEGRWEVGPEGETEIWEVSDGRVQIEREEVLEMRRLVAHSSLSLELQNLADGTSRRLVLAQDDVAVHFGEGIGGNKTPLGFLVVTPDHHVLITPDRCLAYEVEECAWVESSVRYRCDLDAADETLTLERLASAATDTEASPLTLQLGSGVAVDRTLRASVLRSGR